MKHLKKTLLGVAMAAACAAQAQAAEVYADNFSWKGLIETDQSFDTSFTGAAGAGVVSFQLEGYKTLDGEQYYMDVFSLAVNGTTVFSGTFDLGGSGADRVFTSSSGSTVDRLGPRLLDISVPVTLLAGTNTLTFSYASPKTFDGTAHEGFQGSWDEGWGVNRVGVTSAVPEPDTYVLLLAGLAAVGSIVRRRSRAD